MDNQIQTNQTEVNYRKMYFMLFNAITDALRLLEENDIAGASVKLYAAQYFAEEEYIGGE